ncbi:albumin-1-like [Vigna radiata var. radiata]|uniref:Albumin-1-like n=1 Tax=Vigna radiata var. radiata TaxID=3916 RepID=A0A1S3VX99_VIGRR|nr:albumin-1-like [Vigna radiata var. radiata]
MAYARLAPLALFLLATSTLFQMNKIEAADCSGGYCSMFANKSCGTDCVCFPSGIVFGVCIKAPRPSFMAKMIDGHPNLCRSDDECMMKGSGNFCARYPNNIDYGWCFDSDSEDLKGFLAMPAAITK